MTGSALERGLIPYEVVMAISKSKESIYKKALLALNMDYNKVMEKYLDSEHEVSDEDGTRTEYDESLKPIEFEYLDTFIDSAVIYCATLRPWYWLIDTIEFNNNEDIPSMHLRILEGNRTGNPVLGPSGTPLSVPNSDPDDDAIHEYAYDYDKHAWYKKYETYKGHGFGYPFSSDSFDGDTFLYPYLADGEYNVDYARKDNNIYFKRRVHTVDYVDGSTDMSTDKWQCPKLYETLIASRLAIEVAPFIAPDTTVEQRAAQQFQLTLSAMIKIDEHGTRIRNAKPEEFVL